MGTDGFSRRDVLKTVGAGLATAAAAESGAAAPTRYSVGIAPDAPAATVSEVRSAAESVRHTLELGDVRTVVTGEFGESVRTELERMSAVDYVERDRAVRALAETLPWGIDRVDADVAHSDGFTGNGVDIAVLDTGIDSDHPDLNLGTGKAYVNCDSSNSLNTCNELWDDDEGHGTHCAGTAGAAANTEGVVGVSTEATLHAVKVLDSSGSGSTSDIAAGIEWAADQGHEVISMSLGGGGTSPLQDACQYAYDKGSLLVAAAGNSGPCTDCVSYPAAYSTVVAVSATGRNDDLAGYSSTGPEVELAAPGGADSDGSGSITTDEAVYSTYPDQTYDYLVGTSMACPHVSGAGALVMARGRANTEARDILGRTAEDIGLSSNEQGNGLLDAAAAASELVYESGTVSFSQSDATSWTTVSTSSSYTDPVVVAGPPSYNGVDPATTRVRNVGSSGFDLQLDEWDYRDGAHTSEEFGYVVAEAGTGTVGGAPAEAGHLDNVRHNFVSVSFSQSFSTRPVVIAQCTTYNGPAAVTTRLRDVTTSGFEVQLQEEQAADDRHLGERVDYLAVEPVNTSGVEVGSKRVRHNPVPVSLDGFSTAPSLVASVQTWNGIDPGSPRVKDLTASGFETFFDEEVSADSEVQHIGERVGYVALD